MVGTSKKSVPDMAMDEVSLHVVPSGKRLHNELENPPVFHGKIHYFYDHVQCRKRLVYQRVHPIRGHHPLTSAPGCQERMWLQARDSHLRAQII